MVLHGITRNFPTENEEDIFKKKKVRKLSRFITRRVFHIPVIHCCQDTCPISYQNSNGIAKVTEEIGNFPKHTRTHGKRVRKL